MGSFITVTPTVMILDHSGACVCILKPGMLLFGLLNERHEKARTMSIHKMRSACRVVEGSVILIDGAEKIVTRVRYETGTTFLYFSDGTAKQFDNADTVYERTPKHTVL